MAAAAVARSETMSINVVAVFLFVQLQVRVDIHGVRSPLGWICNLHGLVIRVGNASTLTLALAGYLACHHACPNTRIQDFFLGRDAA